MRISADRARDCGSGVSSASSTLNAFIDRVSGIATPFSIQLPDGQKRNVGQGKAKFHVGLRNERALRALGTLDEGDITEAYLQGDIDIEGDLSDVLSCAAPSTTVIR